MKQITIDEAKKMIKENEKVLLMFSTKWCGDCIMTKVVCKKVFPEYEDKVAIGSIDVDEQKAWVEDGKDFQIDHVPTILGYKNGKQIFMHENFISEPELRGLLDKLED